MRLLWWIFSTISAVFPGGGGSLKVLLVDDETAILEQAKIFLQKEVDGLEVETVTSAEKALDLLEENGFDAVVSDYQMPEMDGLEFLEVVRNDRDSDIPFIIFTGKGREEVAIKALNLGADRYLQKGGSPKSQYGVLAQAIVQEVRHLMSEKNLQESEGKYRTLTEDVLDSSDVAIFILDPDFRVVWINQATEKYFGVQRENILDKNKRKLIEEKIKHNFERPERFAEKVIATYEDNTYVENFECHVLPDPEGGLEERWLEHWSKPIESGYYKGGRIEHYTDITENKKAREQLQDNLQRYKKIIESSPDAIIITDAESGEIIEVNRGAEELLDMPRSEITGTKQWKLHPEKDIERYREIFKRTAKSKSSEVSLSEGDLHVIDSNGNKIPIEINSTILELEGRKVVYSTFQNITERKKGEKALKESEVRYRRLFESAQDGMLILDAETGEIKDANPSIQELLGYSKEELVGKELWQIGTFKDIAENKEKFEELVNEGYIRYEDMPLETKEGEEAFVEFVSNTYQAGGEKVVQCNIRDITERKKVEEQLKKSEGKYRNLFETMAQGVVYQDSEGNIISANPAAERILGLSVDQMKGRTSRHPEWRAIKEDGSPFPGEEHPAMVALRTGEEVRDVVMGVYHPEKEDYVWININAVPQFREGEEEPYQVYTTFEDITERKRAEDKLRERVKELSLFYNFSDLVEESGSSLKNILQVLVELIPPVWQYPDITCARLVLDDEESKTDNYDESEWKMKSNILVKEENRGFLEVVYLEERPESDEGPFLEEERNLLEAITERLGKIIRRLELEEEIRESEEKYRNLFEEALDPIFLADAETGIIVDCNRAAADLIERDRTDIIGQHQSALHPTTESGGEFTESFIKHLQENQGETIETQVIAESGKLKDVAIKANLIETGDRTLVQGVFRDITDRKQRREKLQRERKRFREIFNNANDAIYLHELNEKGMPGEFIEVNDVACEMLGYSREELLKMTPNDIDSSEKSDEVPSVMDELFDKGEVRFEMTHQAKDGTEIPVEIHSHLFELEGEKRALSEARDISERKEAEEREEFLHSLLRHDVRNKAQIVQGYLELLQDYDLPEEAEDYVRKAGKGIGDSMDLIEKVRTLRDIKREEEAEGISLSSVIKNVISERESQAQEKGIEIECEGIGCKVLGGSLLEELFSSLVENSIQHSGGNKIRITSQEKENECVITVEDDGRGISDEDKEKIFERGFKSGDTGGSGLGMYLVKEIAENYGGSIEVKDSEMGGARLDIHLRKPKSLDSEGVGNGE